MSIEIDNQQHREIKMLAASEGLSIKDLILVRTIGSASPAQNKLSPANAPEDETEFLFSSTVNYKRLRGAATSPDWQNVRFKTLEELANELGI
ncbi:MAG: hypothetical protein NWR03_15510 [Akkermansiaceae bacterium]|nr:hypothetical protein [Akkermansiaceae bacterium]